MKQSRRPDLKSDFAAEPSYADIMSALDAHERWLKNSNQGKQLTSEDLPVEVRGISFDRRDLSRSDLREVEFFSCSMRGVNWTEADASGSFFTQCDFGEGTRFDRANLQLCRFRHCTGLEAASFAGADVRLADIPGVTPPGNALHQKLHRGL